MIDGQSPLVMILLRLGVAMLVLLIGRWLAHRARTWAERLVQRTHVTNYLEELSIRGVYYGILGLSILTALAILGVPVSSIVAVIGVIIVILGIALQESIGNFAAAVIFYIFQPFQVGDYIETCSIEGTVEEIQLFNTVLRRPDGKVTVLPNGKIQENGLTNYSQNPVLRVACTVGVSYEQDLAKARQVAEQILAADPRILNDPAPYVFIKELGDSAVVMELRGYVRNEDFWTLSWALPELIKHAFDDAGIGIPYPQLDVHVDTSGQAPADA